MDNLIFFLNDAHQLICVHVHVWQTGQCGFFDWNVHFWSVLNFSIATYLRWEDKLELIHRTFTEFFMPTRKINGKISTIHSIFNSTLALSRKHSGKWNVGNKSAWMYTTIIDLSPLCVINLSNPVARENAARTRAKADGDYHDLKKVSYIYASTHNDTISDWE